MRVRVVKLPKGSRRDNLDNDLREALRLARNSLKGVEGSTSRSSLTLGWRSKLPKGSRRIGSKVLVFSSAINSRNSLKGVEG